MQSLQLHLTGVARSWLSKLERETIGSWEEITNKFTSNFKSTYKWPASIEEVKACVRQRNETLRSYCCGDDYLGRPRAEPSAG
jgi:hypothetical protein